MVPDRLALALERAWTGWRGERHHHGNVDHGFQLDLPVQKHWGGRVAFYLFLGGTGGGFVFLEIVLRWLGLLGTATAALGMWIGLALAFLSLLAIFDHLGPVARWRFLYAFRRPRQSWISRGVMIVSVLVLLRLVVALPTVPGAEGLPWAEGTVLGDGLRLLVLGFALAFMIYSGLVISSWNAIAFWNSPLVPVLFAGFSFLGGLAALPVIAWLVLTRAGFGAVDESGRHAPRDLARRGAAVSFPVGLYDGFFGPGTGTFFALGFTRWCGYDLLNATARAKILNLVSNIAALAAFAWAGRLNWSLGLSMAALSFAGNCGGW